MQAPPPHSSSHAQHADAASAEGGTADLGLYSEEDDSATQIAAAHYREQRWIVQVTALDRRIMTTEQLLSRILPGSCINGKTLVWRGGMDDWSPLAAIEELRLRLGRAAPDIEAHCDVRASWPVARVVLASCAIAVFVICLTTQVLRQVGAFHPGSGPPRSVPHPSAPSKAERVFAHGGRDGARSTASR